MSIPVKPLLHGSCIMSGGLRSSSACFHGSQSGVTSGILTKLCEWYRRQSFCCLQPCLRTWWRNLPGLARWYVHAGRRSGGGKCRSRLNYNRRTFVSSSERWFSRTGRGCENLMVWDRQKVGPDLARAAPVLRTFRLHNNIVFPSFDCFSCDSRLPYCQRTRGTCAALSCEWELSCRPGVQSRYSLSDTACI